MTEFEPSLEYAGASGNVNVDTSRDATIHADMTGITADAQRHALEIAEKRGRRGITAVELREITTWLHHGRISSALTNLHKAGRLAALRERRGHAGVYVLPEYVEGREVRPYRPARPAVDEETINGVLLRHRRFIQPHNTGADCECLWRSTEEDPSYYRHLAREIAAALS